MIKSTHTYYYYIYGWIKVHSFIHSFTLAEKDSTASDMSESETSHVKAKLDHLKKLKAPFGDSKNSKKIMKLTTLMDSLKCLIFLKFNILNCYILFSKCVVM